MILTLDPGVTTGWAVLDQDGGIVATSTVQPTGLRLDLRTVLTNHNVNHAVVETVPLATPGHLAETLRHVLSTIGGTMTTFKVEVTYILPGVWKTSSVKESERSWHGQRLTVHQRDAIRMGRYFLRRQA